MNDFDATSHATAACEHIHGFNQNTRWAERQVPAQTADQLAQLAALTAALPQACAQLSALLEQAVRHQPLSMDRLTEETDPAIAIGLARLHLEEARHVAVDLYKLLNAAHQNTSHIVSAGIDHHQEALPWDPP